ncbi:iron-sulfur-binding ferredoxin reductase [Pseudomonas shirazensis]|uniref:iron-sulfur-binding ferredoxin reductase n=1 Tax=Pseudomonas shirazensis TaxID=2745494 RepID=UPI003D2877FE
MPDVYVGAQRISVPASSNLLDALNDAGCNVPYSCRAGSCHACMVRCVDGQPDDRMPEALTAAQRAQGWRLACQCRVLGDLQVTLFDPQVDALPASVCAADWLGEVLRLRVLAQRPLRYRAGQHLLLWLGAVARPYSLASLPGEDDYLEFHIDCGRAGAFCDQARRLQVGDSLRLGELHDGALHYDPDWQARPLWLLASGTGLAPLWAVAREALRQGHTGEIRLLHVAGSGAGHYLAEAVQRLPGVAVELVLADQLDSVLAQLRLSSRQTVALLCGSPSSVERFAKRLFIAGVPRNQVLADIFVAHA